LSQSVESAAGKHASDRGKLRKSSQEGFPRSVVLFQQACCCFVYLTDISISLQHLSPQEEEGVQFFDFSVSSLLIERTQCDGLDPCAFCVDNKLECLYSKEPRRRGPPSGYLRYTETRVAILEILIGLYISKLPKEDGEDLFDPFLETAQTLQSEARICTQDVWDAHKARWTKNCRSAQMVEQLVVSFAPFTPRSSQEAPVKTLLPTLNTAASSSANHHRHSATTSAVAQDKDDAQKANQIPFTQTQRPGSLETTDDHGQLRDTPSRTQLGAGPLSGITLAEQQREEWQASAPTCITGPEPSSTIAQLAYPQSYQQDTAHLPSIGLEDGLGLALGLGDSREYTGSYW